MFQAQICQKENEGREAIEVDFDLALTYIKSPLFKLETATNDAENLNIVSDLLLNCVNNSESYDEDLIIKILVTVDEKISHTTEFEQALELLWRQCIVGSSSLTLQHLLTDRFPSFLSKQLDSMANGSDSEDLTFVKFSDGFTDLIILCKRDNSGKTFQKLCLLINEKLLAASSNRDREIIQNVNNVLMKELQNQCRGTEYINLFPIHLRQFGNMLFHPMEPIRRMGVNLIEIQVDDLQDKIMLKVGFPDILGSI